MNPRHHRSTKFLKGWPQKWAFHFFGPSTHETLVLTSRIAGNWTSLRFLIQRLERHWLTQQDPKAPEVKLALVETFSGVKEAPLKTIVLTHPSPDALAAAGALRSQKPDLNITIHLSFEPSALMRPFWETPPGLRPRDSDLFVVLCEADQKLVKKFYPDAQVKTLHWLGYGPGSKKTGAVTSLCYAGRLSRQKNIHLIILAYASALKMRTDLPPLELAGKWDNGGNQFEEAWTENYESDLRKLVRSLQLEDRVKFLGHLENEEWENFLKEGRKIYVSASLLLDENHGVAPREFIDHGHGVVLPAWGGFLDIFSHSPAETELVEPVRSKTSLWLDPWDLASGIIRRIDRSQEVESVLKSSQNSSIKYVPQNGTGKDLIPSAWAREIQKMVATEEARRLFQTGPFRAIHFLPELRAEVINFYAPKTRTPGKRPDKTCFFPWMTSPENADPQDLWEKGHLYSEGPPTATSERTP